MKVGHSQYHEHTYRPARLATVAKRVCKSLKKLQKKLKFDAIAFTGTSGAAIAYPVSVLTGMHLICVRKTSEKSHGKRIEGTFKNVRRYIILDDFIAEGGTIKKIAEELAKESDAAYYDYDRARCVGVCLYDRTAYIPLHHMQQKIDGEMVPVYRV